MYIQHRCLSRLVTAGLGSGGTGGPTMADSLYSDIILLIQFILSYDIYSILEDMCEYNMYILLFAEYGYAHALLTKNGFYDMYRVYVSLCMVHVYILL